MSTKHESTDAIAILKADHEKVAKLFRDFARLHQEESDEQAEHVAIRICNELMIHATVENEIFYPEVREAIDDDQLLDEAEVEHATANDLIAQIVRMSPSYDKYAAKVIVLGEYIAHHVKQEQENMFPKVRQTNLDMDRLGVRILERKKELMAEMILDGEEPAEEAAETHVS